VYTHLLSKGRVCEAALYTQDFAEAGFEWIDCSDNRHSVVVFIRRAKDTDEFVVTVCNFTPQRHSHYRVGVLVLKLDREKTKAAMRSHAG
jgi:1,4-alpha-glucan branching enzyme